MDQNDMASNGVQPKVFLAPFYLIAATFIGLGDTLYLAYFQHLNLVPGCALKGCEVVLTSVYSKFYGVPLSYLGLVYYAYMLGLALLLAFDPTSKGLRWGALIYTGIGLVLSLVFEFVIQLGLLHALCQYCAISAFTTLVLFCVAVWHFRSTAAAN